jgi:hypothetical protein
VLGLVRGAGPTAAPILCPPGDRIVEAGDQVVLLAREATDTDFERAGGARAAVVDRVGTPTRALRAPRAHRILVLGWNDRVPTLIDTLAARRDRHWQVDLLSGVPLDERDIEGGAQPAANVELKQLTNDYLLEGVLAGVLEDAGPDGYQSIIMLTSDRLASSEESDARAIVGHRMLQALLEDAPSRPHVVIELADAANEGLIQDATTEALIPPLLMSHMLAQLALRPELGVVFNALFAPDGPELAFRDVGLTRAQTFDELERRVAEKGELLLGVRWIRAVDGAPNLLLNPPRATRFEPDESATFQLLVLTAD